MISLKQLKFGPYLYTNTKFNLQFVCRIKQTNGIKLAFENQLKGCSWEQKKERSRIKSKKYCLATCNSGLPVNSVIYAGIRGRTQD